MQMSRSFRLRPIWVAHTQNHNVMAGPDRMASCRKTLVYDDRDPHPCDDARTAALRSTAAGHSAP